MYLPNDLLAWPHSPEHESFSVCAPKYYCQKRYLFADVNRRFEAGKSIGALGVGQPRAGRKDAARNMNAWTTGRTI
jgi:hypothetical protein